MNAKLERITPETAASMLQLNTGNRPVVAKHVTAIAREITEGRWQINGDTVCFSDDRLVDGQHRLMAIIKAGIPIQTFVVRGISSESFITKDSGKRRCTADAMAISGIPNSRAVSAIAKRIWLYQKYGHIRESMATPSSADLFELYEQNPGIQDSIKSVGISKLITQALAAALHYLFKQKDEAGADLFFADLNSGANLNQDDPVFILRQRLVDNIASKSKLPESYISIITIKAWNFRREGKSAKQLRFRHVGESTEQHPVVK